MNTEKEKRVQKIIDAVIGSLFLGCALVVLFIETPLSMMSGVAVLGLGGLGLEALWASHKTRPSLLSKIGPLP